MTRRTLVLCLTVCGWAIAAAPAHAATLCVGGPGCFPSIQDAVDAAHDGDVVQVAAGEFAGGVLIAKSISVVGAGAGNTVIRGGGPVVQIGEYFGENRPIVSLRALTIAGGVNDSRPDRSVVSGGGVWIPQHDSNTTGATVSIRDAVITGNSVRAQELIPPGFCGHLPCAFALGGGIDNSGRLSLVDTKVTDNQVMSPPGVATAVSGGGIVNHPQGTLALLRAAVTGNRVRAAGPNGREATAGGISADGALTIRASVVSGNTVELVSAFPGDVDQVAFGGGVYVGDFPGTHASISDSVIRRNSVRAMSLLNSPDAFAGTFAGGVLGFGDVDLMQSVVDHNSVTSTIPAGAGGFAAADGGGLEIDAHATILATVIVGNTVNAAAGGGFVIAQGGGLANAGQTTLTRSIVLGNSVTGSGADGVAQGGGIWNGTFDESIPTHGLTLASSAITGNRVVAMGGITAQGGGLYSDFPVMRTATLIAGNSPDQCVGC